MDEVFGTHRGQPLAAATAVTLLSGQALAFVKEDFRMFTPPSRAALPIFTDEDSKPHAGATVAVFAALTQFQHPILQFVADYPTPWWRRSNLDRGGSRWGAILRRNHDPAPSPRCR